MHEQKLFRSHHNASLSLLALFHPCLLKTAITRIVHGIQIMKGIMVPLKQRKRPLLKDVRHRTSDIRYRMLTCDIVRAYDVVYDINQRYRMSCTYDIVCPFLTYDIVYDMWRWQHTMSYVWHTMAYVDVQHRTWRTMSHVRCRTSISYISHVRHRTYDVQHNVVCCTYDIVRHARTTSYICTTS